MKAALLEPCDHPGHPLHVHGDIGPYGPGWDIVRTIEVSEPIPEIQVPYMPNPIPAAHITGYNPESGEPEYANNLTDFQLDEHGIPMAPTFKVLRYRKQTDALMRIQIEDEDLLVYKLIGSR